MSETETPATGPELDQAEADQGREQNLVPVKTPGGSIRWVTAERFAIMQKAPSDKAFRAFLRDSGPPPEFWQEEGY